VSGDRGTQRFNNRLTQLSGRGAIETIVKARSCPHAVVLRKGEPAMRQMLISLALAMLAPLAAHASMLMH
jgi:hypothetical protein